MEQIAEVCRGVEPFEITLGDVESFIPVTPTLFIRVARAAYRMREIHDLLNTVNLHSEEQWPYMPHLTIIKMSEMDAAQRGLNLARQLWAGYHGTRQILIDELTFVREGHDVYTWHDLAPIPLGKRTASVR